MRIRTEAVGGYNLDGLVQLALLLLAVSVAGLFMLVMALCRYIAGRSYLGLLRGGLVMVALVVVICTALLT